MSDGLQQRLMRPEQLRKETDSGEVGRPSKGPKISLVYAGDLKMAVLALTSHCSASDGSHASLFAAYGRRLVSEPSNLFKLSLQVEKAQLRAILHTRRLDTLSDRQFTEHHRPLALSI